MSNALTLNPKTAKEVQNLRSSYSKLKVVNLRRWRDLIDLEKKIILDKKQGEKNVRRKEP